MSTEKSREPSCSCTPAESLSEKIFEEEQRYLAPGVQSICLNSHLVVDHGKGVFVTDVNGKTYLDFFSGVTVGSLGHCHPEYTRALKEQLDKVTFGSFTTLTRLEFLKELSERAPGDLKRTQLYSGGAEAVEAALRLARAYTGKFEVIGFWGGFHGKTGGVLGLVGDRFKHQHGPMAAGLFSIPYANCNRCHFDASYPDCSFLCVEFLRKAIRYQTTNSIAAILVEPIQGTSGNIIPPQGYLQALQEVAKEAGALLIADEMITGFGRTGKLFGVEHDGIIPDIMVMGKGIGGGFPVSALISTDEIVAARPFSLPSASSSSYGGNPLAAAAARITLRTILKENLVENSRDVGTRLLGRLKAMEEHYPFIGQVRGKGLMIGVDLVRNRESNEPLSAPAALKIFQLGLEEGILLMISNSAIRVNPALTITPEEADQGLEKLEKIFTIVGEKKIYLR
ncbi:aspartate aminotransferase family protein [Thermodesulfobacteriota bacterium]